MFKKSQSNIEHRKGLLMAFLRTHEIFQHQPSAFSSLKAVKCTLIGQYSLLYFVIQQSAKIRERRWKLEVLFNLKHIFQFSIVWSRNEIEIANELYLKHDVISIYLNFLVYDIDLNSYQCHDTKRLREESVNIFCCIIM